MTSLCQSIESFGQSIANPCRYKIIQELARQPLTVNEIVEAVGQSQPLVSQHLRVLKQHDLVTAERLGQQTRYSLNTPHVLELLSAITQTITNK